MTTGRVAHTVLQTTKLAAVLRVSLLVWPPFSFRQVSLNSATPSAPNDAAQPLLTSRDEKQSTESVHVHVTNGSLCIPRR